MLPPVFALVAATVHWTVAFEVFKSGCENKKTETKRFRSIYGAASQI
jgi:hypothetical protein